MEGHFCKDKIMCDNIRQITTSTEYNFHWKEATGNAWLCSEILDFSLFSLILITCTSTRKEHSQ